ncbi:hypothetical protein HKX48_005746 [Thoreauomyces humboldtii]|nr:hypothetical protein HKX48_005746 [Thoreauomyces humboldtii]
MKLSLASILSTSLALSAATLAAPIQPVNTPSSTQEFFLGVPTITFLNQVASQNDDGSWHLNFHGYLTSPVHDLKITAALAILKVLAAGDADKISTLQSRVGLFASVGVPLQQVSVTLATGQSVDLPDFTDASGQFNSTVDVHFDSPLVPGSPITFTNIPSLPSETQVGGAIFPVAAEGWSVISDVDDSIKVSDVNDKVKLLEHTFLEPFTAVAGMSEVYTRLQSVLPSPSFHYLSKSPWNLYDPLSQFFVDNDFPAGQVILRDFSLQSPSSILDFVTQGVDYKVARIQQHMGLYPARRLVMVGDSTEMDPESYGIVARQFPDNVQCIAIRVVTGVNPKAEATQITPARFAAAFLDVPVDRWFTFTDSKQIDPADVAAGNCRAAAV